MRNQLLSEGPQIRQGPGGAVCKLPVINNIGPAEARYLVAANLD